MVGGLGYTSYKFFAFLFMDLLPVSMKYIKVRNKSMVELLYLFF